MDKTPIGFNLRVQLEWLNQTAEMALSGKKLAEIRAILNEQLADKISINNQDKLDSGSVRGKTIGILTKIWISPPPQIKGLHQDGLRLLDKLPTIERLPIHWGMSMAVYPFFGQVAETVGRLLRLQNSLNMAQVQRRMSEQLGESVTVARSTRRVIRTFVDWGVLNDSQEPGSYQASMPVLLQNPLVTSWLLEAQLIASGSKTGLLKMLTDAPSLYPFKLSSLNLLQVENNPRLELFQQGLDQNLISLRAS